MTFILLILFLFQTFQIRQETFLIPSNMKPLWVNVEYDNPKCPALDGTELKQEFVVPESGYICTSSSSYKGAYQRRFFLVDAEGNRTLLESKGNIWQQGVLSKDEPSLDKGQPRCKVSLNQFFYGKKDDLKSDNPIFQDETFLSEYHPECRRTGISVEAKKP